MGTGGSEGVRMIGKVVKTDGAYSEEAITTLQEHAASSVVDVLSGVRPPHLADPSVWQVLRGRG